MLVCYVWQLELQTKVKQRFVKILQSQTLSPIANRAFLWLKSSTCDMGSTSNVKAVVAAFTQEMALVGAFSVITNLCVNLRLKL